MADQSLRQTSTRSYGSTMDVEVGFGTGHFDPATFNRLCDKITANSYQITKHATSLEKTLKTIGTRNDTDALRDSVHTVTSTATKIISETTGIVKEVTNLTAGRDTDKLTKLRVTKLTSEFQAIVQSFTDTQKKILAKMKATPPVTTSYMETEDQQAALVEEEERRHQQLQYQQQLEFEQGLMLEREQRVQQIEADIVDVNDIMRELGNLVVEQRAHVDTIEANIDSTYTQVEGGREQLQKAETYQSKYRKRLFCLLAAGLVVLIIVIIILVTQLKH